MKSHLAGGQERHTFRFAFARGGAAVTLAALLTASCTEQPTDPTPDPGLTVAPSFSRAGAPGQQGLAGVDAEYAAIARDAPGFGGMFYDATGRLNIYVTAAGASSQAQSRILTRVSASLRAQDRDVPSAANITVLPAARDYAELTVLRDRMDPVLAEPGVVFTDIDESQNRLRIGVLDGTGADQIQAVLDRLDVPLDAVTIETTEPIEPLATLRDTNDPIAGGLQIWRFTPPSTANICTLGFNVRFTNPAESQHFFFTNSHCTEVRGAVTGTLFRQGPLSLGTRIVAVEVEDPPFFTCQFAGYRCRWSDAALAQYLPDFTARLAMIYQTLDFGTTAPATLEILEEERFTITGERPFPMMGDIINKVGRTSGWTRGPVIGTCINVGVAGASPPIVMLCQDRVQAYVAGGDSGSPAFEQIGGRNPVRLVGILWGGSASSFVMSAMENIHMEFGEFRVR
ncbi:MAG TPA: hypothetical protein VK912_03865 [Longimicrobiales bacterium]|nr:hypothetical protein [Longimicrobiales bacterium]